MKPSGFVAQDGAARNSVVAASGDERRPVSGRAVKLLSFNINGIKSVCDYHGGLSQLLAVLKADVVCVQETKTTRLTLTKDLAVAAGFRGYFSFCRETRAMAYAGTATFVRHGTLPVVAVQDGITGTLENHGDTIVRAKGFWKADDVAAGRAEAEGDEWGFEMLQKLDQEGRCVVSDHGAFVLLNVYAPAYSEVSILRTIRCSPQ